MDAGSQNDGGLELQVPIKKGLPHEPIFIKISDAARLLSMSRAAVWERIQKGAIPGVRIAGMWRVPLAALQQMAAEAMAAKADDNPVDAE